MEKLFKLQALRIPTGWVVGLNKFYEIEPTKMDENDILSLLDFTEDILQITHKHEDIIVDLGWYPDMDPKGNFRLVLIKNQDWQNPIEIFESRSSEEVRDKIDDFLETAYNKCRVIQVYILNI